MDHDSPRSAPDSTACTVELPPTTNVRLSSPGSVVASIPLMFGFHPEDSLVVLGLTSTPGGDKERVRTGVRIGLDQIRGHEREAAADLAQRLQDHGADSALLVAFGPRGATGVKARPDCCRKLMAAVRAQLGAGPKDERVHVVDAIYTAGGRWWSYMCRNVRCCPASGTLVPTEPPAALASALAYQGVAVFPSRQALDETLVPYGGPAAQAVADALAAISGVVVVAEARRLADVLLARCANGMPEFSNEEGASLLAAMAEWQVRDHLASAAADVAGAERLLSLSIELARRSSGKLDSLAPYSLTAWAAWSLGRSALAQCAVDRALAVDPDYTFAALIRAGLRHGITPESVRASAETTRRELAAESGPPTLPTQRSSSEDGR